MSCGGLILWPGGSRSGPDAWRSTDPLVFLNITVHPSDVLVTLPQDVKRHELVGKLKLLTTAVGVADLVVDHPEPVACNARKASVKPALHLAGQIQGSRDDISRSIGWVRE